MPTTSHVAETVKQFILREFLPEEDPAQLTDSTPLVTSGILDSIATLKLVLFLEEEFGVSLAAHETGPEHLDSVERIAALVRAKQ